MHAGFADPDLWLLRGLPQASPEDVVIYQLQRLGIALPAFWYLPRHRKRTLFHRGYAFIRFCNDDHADDAIAILADPPPQLRDVRIDRSNAPPVPRVIPCQQANGRIEMAPSEQDVPFTRLAPITIKTRIVSSSACR